LGTIYYRLRKFRVIEMDYAWPLPHPDPRLDEALDIALGYLEATGQAEIGDDTQHLVARAVLNAWLEGSRHKIRLANFGIVAAQQAAASRKQTGQLQLDVLRDLALP
jgi:hypothetical protein